MGAAALLGGLVLPGCSGGDSSTSTAKKVIVIGAVIAGLTAARDLVAAGFNVTLLEAQNRIGGRLKTDRSLSAPVDLGASWIHGVTNNPITTLANAIHATRVSTSYASSILYDRTGDVPTTARTSSPR